MTVKVEYRHQCLYVVMRDGVKVGYLSCLGFTDWTVVVGERAEGAGSYDEAARLAVSLAEELAVGGATDAR